AEDLAAVLDELKIGTQESIKVIGALGTNTERLTELQKLSNDAFAEGTSLQNEYNTKNQTTQAELAKLQNNFNNLAITVGSVLLPVINELVDKVVPIVQRLTEAFQNLDPNVQKVILVFLGLLAAIGPISFVIGTIISSIGALVGAFGTIASAISLLFSPIGLVVAGIGSIIGALYLLNERFDFVGTIIEEVKKIRSEERRVGK